MGFKKSMLILILAIFLISIASVCAADANDVAIASEDTNQMDLSSNNVISEDNLKTSEDTLTRANDDETVSEEADSEILSAGEGTYNDMITEIGDGGDKNLTKSYCGYTDGNTNEIKNSGVIDGNGAVIDVGESDTRTFYVTASDVPIKNANYGSNGGAIYFSKSCSVINGNFIDNNAISYGGDIYFNEQTTDAVTVCNFANKYANDGSDILSQPQYNATVSVKVDNIIYGDKAVIEVTVPDDATGNVTVIIDGKPYYANVSGGKAVLVISGLTAGNKTVEVTYNGDYKYFSKSNSTNFTVSVADVGMMIVIAQNVTYAENEIITAYVNAEGNVTFKINSQTYDTVNITDGKAVFSVPLNAGNYTVEAIYNGQSGFSSKSVETNFTVEKADPIMSIEVQNIIYGGVEHIRVHVNAEGDVTIRVIDTGIVETISLDNGEKDIILRAGPSDSYEGNATLNLYNLRGGRYPVEVTYNGNSNYNKLTASSEFEVYRADTSMYIEAEPYIDAGEDQMINITLSSVKATGWVYVYLAGRKSPRPVHDGLANYTTPLLESGKYQYVIVYEGDENFNSYIAQGTFEVGDVPSLKDVSIDLDVVPYLHAGETQVINITMSDSLATGRVTIILDNNNYTRILDNGVANFTTPVLPGGNYTVVVIYEGNYMFNSNWTYSEFVVEKITHEESPLDVTVDNIEVGGTAIVTVELPKNATGNVTVSIEGVSHTTSNITDGIARFEIENLTAGIKTISVDYAGDDNYLGNHTTANITVTKANPEIKVDVVIDEDELDLYITAPGDATKPALVVLDGVGYYANITDGKGKLNILGLSGGKHDVTVKYLGDDRYNQSESQYKSFEVCNVSSGVSVKADGVTYGDKAVIEVTVPDDATGNVTVTIGEKSYTENVSSAKALLIVSGIGAGNYTVNVTYNGDVKYASGSNFINLEVSKAKTSIKVIDNGNGNVIVVVSDNVHANVTIKSGNNIYDAVGEDSIAMIDLVNETPGVHDIEVFCAGDENHTAAYAKASITIKKFKTQITANAVTTTYNVNKKLVISLKDVKGNALSGVKVTVKLKGTKTYTTDKNGQVKVATKGLAPKSYTAEIAFSGNANYDKSTRNVKVTVKKATPKMTAKKKTFKAKTKIKKYTITLKDNTGKAMKKVKVTLKVKGKTYKATTNSKGKATFKIKNLKKKGTFKAVITYKGNKNYNKVTKKVKIKIIVTFKTVSKGSKDKSAVKDIQQALKNHGYYLTYKGQYLKIDGIYHSHTERSVKEFQHDKGLKVTGKVDEKTAHKLGMI